MQTARNKIKSREQLQIVIKEAQASGGKVGFSSGAFDLLHAGHVSYLEAARAKCDLLIVGVNSDASIKAYKSDLRPIVEEADRLIVLAGLAAVDYVFSFGETNNNKNIEELKPDIYFKAGDYQEAELSSAPLIKAYGGRVEIVPFEAGLSSSGIIEKVLSKYSSQLASHAARPLPEKRPAVFFDRDGTLIEHVEYLHEPEKLKLFAEGLAPLKRLQEQGYRIIIVTNQPGIGLGYFTKEQFYKVNLALLKAAGKAGVKIDKVYFSPCTAAEDSTCRKPGTGMIDRAIEELNVDLSKSFVVGDTTTDVQLARNAGCAAILVNTGYAGKDGVYNVKPDYTAANLNEVVEFILSKTEDSK